MKCRQEVESIDKYFDGITHIKAPDGFTDNVMESIYKLDLPQRPRQAIVNTISYPIFRRLGMSMLLTAGIMLLTIFIPPQFGGAISSFAAERSNEITIRTNQISETITDFDKSVKKLVDKVGRTF